MVIMLILPCYSIKEHNNNEVIPPVVSETVNYIKRNGKFYHSSSERYLLIMTGLLLYPFYNCRLKN